MCAVRWILVFLYLTLVGGLSAVFLASGEVFAWIVVGVTLLALALFILGAGHKGLFRPIGRPRIFFPVVSASLMLTALLAGLTFALMETFRMDVDDEPWVVVAFWASLVATWIFWTIILYAYTRKKSRYQAIFQLAQFIFAGSIAELLASVPSHIFVSKRGGCFAGIMTATGVLAGLVVMIWSFGPAIFLLFLREAHGGKKAVEVTGTCALPTVHTPIQFRLRTLLLAMLLVAVACALLRSFWGYWPVAALAAWGILLLVVPLLLTRPWIMLAALLAAVAGLIYSAFSTGFEEEFVVLVIPTGLLGVVVLKLVMGGPIPRPAARLDRDRLGD